MEQNRKVSSEKSTGWSVCHMNVHVIDIRVYVYVLCLIGSYRIWYIRVYMYVLCLIGSYRIWYIPVYMYVLCLIGSYRIIQNLVGIMVQHTMAVYGLCHLCITLNYQQGNCYCYIELLKPFYVYNNIIVTLNYVVL